MRGRVAIVALFLLGALLTVLGGVALAVTGPSSSGEISIAQYGGGGGGHGDDDDDDDGGEGGLGVLGVPPPPSPQPSPPAAPRQPRPPRGGQAPGGGRAGEEAGRAPGQRGGQVRGELPFTGWAALVVMFVGLALLTLGVIARWRLDAAGKPA